MNAQIDDKTSPALVDFGKSARVSDCFNMAPSFRHVEQRQ